MGIHVHNIIHHRCNFVYQPLLYFLRATLIKLGVTQRAWLDNVYGYQLNYCQRCTWSLCTDNTFVGLCTNVVVCVYVCVVVCVCTRIVVLSNLLAV